MSKYIDAEALRKLFSDEELRIAAEGYLALGVEPSIVVSSVDKAREISKIIRAAIDSMPAANVAEAEQSMWIWREEWKESTSDGPAECQSAGWGCDSCGMGLSEYLAERGERVYFDDPDKIPDIAFCPDCGAKMA